MRLAMPPVPAGPKSGLLKVSIDMRKRLRYD